MPLCLYAIFAVAPTERSMGVVQRIFYVHVPSALTAFLAIVVCAAFSAAYLWRRADVFDRVAHASAELAFVFCTIVLVTGPIWARPVWGVWWTGEARLNSTLVLWLLLAGYLALRAGATDRGQAARWGAVIAIVGLLDLPIIYKSVEWWRGLHPKVLRASGGQGVDPIMGRTLVLCLVTFALIYLALLILRCGLGRLRDEIEALQRAARRPAAPPAAVTAREARS